MDHYGTGALAARALKRLQGAISVSVVEPSITEQGWRFGPFGGAGAASLDGDTYLHQVYTRADPHLTGRATVPVLWDKQRRTIVNNESADITTVRFDAAYHGLFKLNRRRLADYPRLSGHLRAMLALPGVARTVDVGHIKAGYASIRAVNPSGIVPAGPDLSWLEEAAAPRREDAHA